MRLLDPFHEARVLDAAHGEPAGARDPDRLAGRSGRSEPPQLGDPARLEGRQGVGAPARRLDADDAPLLRVVREGEAHDPRGELPRPRLHGRALEEDARRGLALGDHPEVVAGAETAHGDAPGARVELHGERARLPGLELLLERDVREEARAAETVGERRDGPHLGARPEDRLDRASEVRVEARLAGLAVGLRLERRERRVSAHGDAALGAEEVPAELEHSLGARVREERDGDAARDVPARGELVGAEARHVRVVGLADVGREERSERGVLEPARLDPLHAADEALLARGCERRPLHVHDERSLEASRVGELPVDGLDLLLRAELDLEERRDPPEVSARHHVELVDERRPAVRAGSEVHLAPHGLERALPVDAQDREPLWRDPLERVLDPLHVETQPREGACPLDASLPVGDVLELDGRETGRAVELLRVRDRVPELRGGGVELPAPPVVARPLLARERGRRLLVHRGLGGERVEDDGRERLLDAPFEEALERVRERVRRGGAARRVLLEAAEDDRLVPGSERRVLRPRRNGRARDDLDEERRQVRAREGDRPREELVEDDTERPDVGRGRGRESRRLLGREVGRRPLDPARRDLLVRLAGHAEVEDPHAATGLDEHVRGLHVAVDDPRLVDGGEGACRARHDRESALARDLALSEEVGEGLPVDELHEAGEASVLRPEDAVARDDGRVVDAPHERALPDEVGLVLRLLREEDLDGDPLPAALGLEDLRLGSAADLAREDDPLRARQLGGGCHPRWSSLIVSASERPERISKTSR